MREIFSFMKKKREGAALRERKMKRKEKRGMKRKQIGGPHSVLRHRIQSRREREGRSRCSLTREGNLRGKTLPREDCRRRQRTGRSSIFIPSCVKFRDQDFRMYMCIISLDDIYIYIYIYHVLCVCTFNIWIPCVWLPGLCIMDIRGIYIR